MKLYTRREFTKVSVAVAALLPVSRWLYAAEGSAKPNSKVEGVQLGLNVPYSFANGQMNGDDILRNCVQLGLSAVELRTQPVEVFLGAPNELIYPKKSDSGKSDELAKWRKSASMDRAKEFRKKYEDAGVLIEIVK